MHTRRASSRSLQHSTIWFVVLHVSCGLHVFGKTAGIEGHDALRPINLHNEPVLPRSLLSIAERRSLQLVVGNRWYSMLWVTVLPVNLGLYPFGSSVALRSMARLG